MSATKLNYLRQGSGSPPIVFVHGFLCRHQDWKHQVEYFSKNHDVIACDLPGHGESPAEESISAKSIGAAVARLLDDLDLHGAVLVGHSMGCRFVMEARRQAKERVAGLVLLDGSRSGTDAKKAVATIDAMIAEKGYLNVVESMFDGMFFGAAPSWKADKLAQVLAMPESTGIPMIRSVSTWDATDLEDALDAMDVPVHVIQNTTMDFNRVRKEIALDELSPFQQVVLEKVADVTSETLPAGHFSMLEIPELVNAGIERFIAEKII